MIYAIKQVCRNWREGTITNIIDPSLNNGSQNIMRCIHIGLLCVQEKVVERLTMATIELMHNSYSVSLPLPLEHVTFMCGWTWSLPISDMQWGKEYRGIKIKSIQGKAGTEDSSAEL